ncbi:GNAT family N-acetyltransferase [Roseibium sediminicola]|uniref:N-acetyltransferase domain-containing protein n=1 Tax=Roseibium sediminicola TaxID=2933272 RepID=A0ABT0GXV6_9HYPH|nr:GNAT family N-acetyltransferase [Roseibium sp. CAU 1639]MCK7614272.1 hypothetical protein [Roseibium sp. CAU 1639]
MQTAQEFFGTPENIAAMGRSTALWSLLRGDPRFAYYGRLVALSQPVENTSDVLISLARLQGASPCYFFPKSGVDTLFAELERKGLSADRHEHFQGGESAYMAARATLAEHHLPPDLTVRILDGNTPDSVLAEVIQLMESCGVMPVPASFLRGSQGNGICLVACDPHGAPVAVATSIFMHPAESDHANTVFWGMLATRPDRRGEKVALVLGAKVIVHMWEEKGARAFMTGVRQDNASSTALCNRLGVIDTEFAYAVCVDPQTLGRDSVTK